MLEVVFSDSTKGAMKIAKNYNEKNMLGGATKYFGKKPTKTELKKHFEGQAIGGDSQDVVYIGFALDIGDISGKFDGSKRQNVFQKVWGRFDFDHNEQEQFFHNQLSESEKQMFSNYWCDLVTENAPLRAIVNGKLISVPEEFYDYIIVKNIPDNDFIMARLIGKIIGNYQLGVSDSWYALRVDKMIEENKLMIVENKDMSHPYGKILKKVVA